MNYKIFKIIVEGLKNTYIVEKDINEVINKHHCCYEDSGLAFSFLPSVNALFDILSIYYDEDAINGIYLYVYNHPMNPYGSLNGLYEGIAEHVRKIIE